MRSQMLVFASAMNLAGAGDGSAIGSSFLTVGVLVIVALLPCVLYVWCQLSRAKNAFLERTSFPTDVEMVVLGSGDGASDSNGARSSLPPRTERTLAAAPGERKVAVSVDSRRDSHPVLLLSQSDSAGGKQPSPDPDLEANSAVTDIPDNISEVSAPSLTRSSSSS